MKSLTIRTTLGLVIGAIGLLLIAVSGAALKRAYDHYENANRVAIVAPISQAFFKALQAHRLERGNIIISAGAAAPAEKATTDSIAENRATAEAGYTDGMNRLQVHAARPGVAAVLQRLKASHDAVEALRPRAFAAIGQPREQRDAQLLQEWPRATQAYLDSLQAASDFLENAMSQIDTQVDLLISVKQDAWTARNFVGSYVLRLLTGFNSSAAWPQATIITHATDMGRFTTAWQNILDNTALPSTPKAVKDAVEAAKSFFSGPLATERDTVFRAFAAGEKPPVVQAEFQPRVTDGLNLINAMANAALDEIVARADAEIVAAQKELLVGGLVMAAAVIFTILGFMIVQWRVSGPIQGMTAAMARLSQGDLEAPVPYTDRGAEIGKMADALQVFKDSMIAREKAEADIARQREDNERVRQEREARERAAGEEIAALVNKVGMGDLNSRLTEAGKEGFFLTTSQELNRLTATLQSMTAELANAMGAMAGGDLSKTVRGDYQGVFGEIKGGVNGMAERMREFAGRLTETAMSVRTASSEISSGSLDLSQRTESQAASIEETAASMHEITTTVKQNADNARAANQLAVAARDTAEKGGNVTAQAVQAVSQIENSAQKISDIVGLIDEIAFQTNLLALNASVEAARAGEAGKGFAVVAQEVRALAQRSANASKEIKALISESNAQVKTGAALVNQTGSSLADIVASIKKVSDIVAEIAAASQEQATGLDQINTAVGSMDEMTQRNAALVEETSASAQSLASQAHELAELVGFFKIDGAPANPGAQPARPALVQPAPAAPARPAALKPAQARPAPAKPAPAKPGATPAPRMLQRTAGHGAPAARPADDDWQEF